jgi:hypothetical protein
MCSYLFLVMVLLLFWFINKPDLGTAIVIIWLAGPCS